MGLGAAVVFYLWAKAGAVADDKAGPPAPRKFQRDFKLPDLAIYDGKEGRLAYVALREPEEGVYDVTKDAAQFLEFAGRELGADTDPEAMKSRYQRVGRLVRPREWTVDEVARMDGRDGRPVFIAAKGEVFDVTRGTDFYGPDGGYNIMAGRDASRALALVSLDMKDIDNNRLDDLTASDLMTLDEWRFKFHSKYTLMGTLAGWSMAGSPLPNTKSTGVKQGTPAAVTGVPPIVAVSTAGAAAGVGAALSASGPVEVFLTSNKDRHKVKLVDKIQLSPDTYLFRLGLPKPTMRLGLPIGKHIKFWCPNKQGAKPGEWNGRPDEEKGSEIERKYTPSSLDSEPTLGHFDVVIKVYRPLPGKFVDGGKMSQFFGDLKVGDTVDVAGPFGLIEYHGNGDFTISRKKVAARHVGMMAGGTGVTPMLQLVKAVMLNPTDSTKISLIFANQTEQDILVRDMLEDLQKKNPDRFKLHYTLDRPPANWKYSSGFITDSMIKEHLPPPGPGTLILMCGPPPMVRFFWGALVKSVR